jgi:WD40 repeat protein
MVRAPAPEVRTDDPPGPAAGVAQAASRDVRLDATDRYGDPLPAGAVARLGTVRWRHEAWVGPFALAPDGLSMASTAGRTLSFWELPDGQPRRHLALPADLRCLAYAPDGKSVAAGAGDGLVRILDTASGKETRRFTAHPPEPRSPFGGVYGVAFGPGGRSLVTWGSDGTLRQWDLAAGTELRRFGQEPGALRAAVSPDGKWLAAGYRRPDRAVQLWDVGTGEAVRSLAAADEVGTVAFSPDGRTLAAAVGKSQQPGQVVRWEVASGRPLGTLPGHDSDIFALAFAADGKMLATGGYDRTIRLWDPATGKELRKIGPLPTPVYQLVFTSDGRRLIGRLAENRLRFWDPTTGQEALVPDAPDGVVSAVAYAPTGKFLATASIRTVWVWDSATAQLLAKLQGHEATVSDLALSADGKLLVSSAQDGTVCLWNPVTGKKLRRIQASQRWLGHVAVSPEGRTIACWSMEDRPDQVQLWDASTGRHLRSLAVVQEEPGVLPTLHSLSFSPDGRQLLTCSGTSLWLLCWDVATGQPVRLGGRHDGGVNWAAYSTDGRTVAAASMDGTLFLWETATGQPRLILKGLGYTTTLAFSPDGRLLALGNDGSHRQLRGDTLLDPGQDQRGRVRVVNTADGRLLHAFAGHVGGIYRLAFAPDGQTLASASADTTVLLWDVSPWAAMVRRPGGRLSEAQLKALWQDLRGDAARAHRAVVTLAAAPSAEVIPILREHLRPVVAADPARVAALIRQLDSPTFAEREQAMTELRMLGDNAEPALQRALAGKPRLEAQRRITQLLQELDPLSTSGKRLRTMRALELLERLGGAEGLELLRQLAAGDPQAWLTREGKASVARIDRRNLMVR